MPVIERDSAFDSALEITSYVFTITQRDRGVYLAHWSEDRDGFEEWDAFSTLDKAKRWCAKVVERKRLPWEDTIRDGYWPSWCANLDEGTT